MKLRTQSDVFYFPVNENILFFIQETDYLFLRVVEKKSFFSKQIVLPFNKFYSIVTMFPKIILVSM